MIISRVLPAVAGILLTFGSSAAQSICTTQYLSCRLPGVAPSGTSCYCNSPYGPIAGAVSGNALPSNQFNAALPSFCCTPAGKLGPYPNPGVPVGGACTGTTPYGIVYGQACY